MSGQREPTKRLSVRFIDLFRNAFINTPQQHFTIVMLLKAKKIIINIDKNQLKNLNIKFDLKILDDVANFVNFLIKQKNIKKRKKLTS